MSKPYEGVSWSVCGDGTGIRLQVEQRRVKFVRVRARRWWQFWKPKHYPEYLAEEPLSNPIEAGSTVRLQQSGTAYTALVNDQPVLTWPPRVLGEEPGGE